MEGYITVKERAVGEYEEKRSRFIATICPVSSEEEAVAFIKEQKQKYFDARHNVYVWVLASGECRFSDDGEPHGTAAKPMLDIINGRKLKNVCMVITRYFGGVLLGTGGLVRAYGEAAKDCIKNSTVVQMGVLSLYSVKADYVQYNRLLPFLESFNAQVTDTVFEDSVTVKFSLDSLKEESLNEKLTDAFFGRLKAEKTGETLSIVNILNIF